VASEDVVYLLRARAGLRRRPRPPRRHRPLDQRRTRATERQQGRLRDKAGRGPLDGEDLRGIADRVGELLRLGRSAISRYRGVFDGAADAITLLDEDGQILDANDAAVQLYGWSREELRRMRVFDLNPTLPEDHMQRVTPVLEIGRSHTIETTNVSRDGTVIPVEVHSRAYLEDGRKLIVAIARDIREREHAQNELAASEERYVALLEAVDKGVLVHDARGRVLSMNAAARRILGIDLAAISDPAALDFWDLYDQDGHAMPWPDNPVARAIRSNSDVDSTLLGLVDRRNGIGRWISISVVPQYHTGENRPFQLISLFSDVTELKRASELFDEVQSLARIGGWTYDFRQQHMYWTRAVYRLLGLDPESSVGREGLLPVVHPGDREALQKAFAQTRRQGTALDIELRVRHPERGEIWVRVLGRMDTHRDLPNQMTGTIQEITARKLEEERLRRLARTDALTSLLNRDAILGEIGQALASSDAEGGPALMYIDLDRFKVVNDLLGHAAGDRLLVSAARRIVGALPGNVRVARFGGDEFLALVPEAASDDAVWQMADAVHMAFAASFRQDGEEFVITPSIGIARHPQDGKEVQELLNHADVAMYEAKRRGRNNWQMFSPALAGKLKERLLIETQLKRAIDQNELKLVYQPKIALDSGHVVGAEALLRWHSRTLGELPPDTFIPIAETSGDIVRIGAWVLDQACRQLRQWLDEGVAIDHVAVNVSFRQILGERFEREVRAALDNHRLPASALELEMTERALIEDSASSEQVLRNLRELGIRIVIDDFGEGYSALGYLRRLPIAGIKISHHFMQQIPANATDARLCEAIAEMADALGLSVVAEGIENPAQREFVAALGIRHAQGFHFAPPLAPEAFLAYLRGAAGAD
jgi:diguanylate cyclase (GGDEF)-like protein/PAS domain S-box-containing protein